MTMAFVFPGQGSHSVGMLHELAQVYSEIESVFAEASDVLGYDLWDICLRGPKERLDSTVVTQPAMLAADIALWTVWNERTGLRPVVMAGHSLGEYSALVAAGVFSFVDALRLVALRGQLMQEAVPMGEGAMAAIIGASRQQVLDLCQQAAQSTVLSVANDNAPGQIVVAGHTAAVKRAVNLAQSCGARKAVLLPVSVPAHSALMRSAVEPFSQALFEVAVSAPTIPVIHNVDLLEHHQPDEIRNVLLQQLTQSVRWVETMQLMVARGVTECVECGPGKVLVGLNKRIAPDLVNHVINTPVHLDQALDVIQEDVL